MHCSKQAACAVVVGAAFLGVPAAATAGGSPSAELGQHVATCAQEDPGQRDQPPAITCTHDGMQMSFPNFGAVVEHMRELHS